MKQLRNSSPVEWGKVRVEHKAAATLERLSVTRGSLKLALNIVPLGHCGPAPSSGGFFVCFENSVRSDFTVAADMLSTFLCPEALVSLVLTPVFLSVLSCSLRNPAANRCDAAVM